MKKKARKLGAILVALVMALSMCMTAFAAQATTTTAGTLEVNNDTDKVVTTSAEVTISNIPKSASVSFSTYQVLYATYDKASNSMEYHLTDWAMAALVNTSLTADTTTGFMSEKNAIAALAGITAIGSDPAAATDGTSSTEQSELVNYLAGYVAGLNSDDDITNNVSAYNSTFTAVTGTAGASGTVSTTATLPVGAYLVLPASDTMAFLNMLVSVDVSNTSDTAVDGWMLKAHDAVLKGDELTIDKKVSDGTVSGDMVEDGDTAQAQVGDTLYYSIQVDVPKFAANSTNITFKVTDTPSNVSIDSASVVVTPYYSKNIAGIALTNGTDYKVSLDNQTGVLTVDFSDNYLNTFYKDGTYPYEYVIITYQAELLSSALVTSGNTNTAKLEYGNNTNSINSAEDGTTVYTYQLDLTKLGENSSTCLSNASFKIYTIASNGTKNYLTFIKDSAGNYVVADSTDLSDDGKTKYEAITTGSSGDVILKGLDGSVMYYIEESVAPSGYTLNTNYLAFTITGAKDSASGDLTGLIGSVSASEYESGNPAAIETYPDTDSSNKGSWTIAVKQENSANTASLTLTLSDTKIAALPSTGGMGTILFTVIGCAVLAGAACLYMTYRRRLQR